MVMPLDPISMFFNSKIASFVVDALGFVRNYVILVSGFEFWVYDGERYNQWKTTYVVLEDQDYPKLKILCFFKNVVFC